MNYRYEYVSLRTGGGFWADNADYEHRKIIDEYAAKGWRYVGFVPARFYGGGGMKEIDLVFEKPEE